MRLRDENKRNGIVESVMKLVNSYGFSDVSMSKIAKAAGVSPATIYIYFKDKEDLIKSTFDSIKEQLDEYLFDKIDFTEKAEDTAKKLWSNFFDFCLENKEKFAFIEQFLNSPNAQKINCSRFKIYKEEFQKVIKQGRDSGVFKNIPDDLILILTTSPLIQIARSHINGEIEITKKKLFTAFSSSWASVTC